MTGSGGAAAAVVAALVSSSEGAVMVGSALSGRWIAGSCTLNRSDMVEPFRVAGI
jgi:hypothetical protein